jgi:hypothetical protein
LAFGCRQAPAGGASGGAQAAPGSQAFPLARVWPPFGSAAAGNQDAHESALAQAGSGAARPGGPTGPQKVSRDVAGQFLWVLKKEPTKSGYTSKKVYPPFCGTLFVVQNLTFF